MHLFLKAGKVDDAMLAQKDLEHSRRWSHYYENILDMEHLKNIFLNKNSY